MVNLQSEFITFHDAIKLDSENEILREKRDILLNKLKEKISDDATSYTHFNQGSYAMGTGIKPNDGDYDIDVGLKFDIDHDDYEDPVVVKKWIKDALDGHTKKMENLHITLILLYMLLITMMGNYILLKARKILLQIKGTGKKVIHRN